MTAPLTAQLIAALQAGGISAFPEFPQHDRRIPAGRFLTLGAARCDAEGALPADCGFAIPITVSLRVRTHVPPHDDIRPFAAYAADILFSELKRLECDVRRVQCGEIRYQNALDKLVLETEITVGCVLHCRQEEESQYADDA